MPDRNWKGASVTLLAIIGFIFIISQLSRIASGYNVKSYYDSKTTDEQWIVVTPQRY